MEALTSHLFLLIYERQLLEYQGVWDKDTTIEYLYFGITQLSTWRSLVIWFLSGTSMRWILSPKMEFYGLNMGAYALFTIFFYKMVGRIQIRVVIVGRI